jgi:Flp pilus assembly protein TadD
MLLSGAAGVVFLSLAACSSDLLTYSQDAKHEGMKQYNDGKFPEAAGSFRNAIRQDPTDPEAEYWLGRSFEQTKSFHEAINAYKTALGLMPKSSSPRFNHDLYENTFDRLAKVVAENDASGTETELIVKTASDLKSAQQYQLLGRIFQYKGDPDSSLEDYRRAAALEPDTFVVEKELGLYLDKLAQNQEAGSVLRDAYRLNQSDESVNAALRHLGIVPGPALLAQDQIEKSIVPNALVPEQLMVPAAHTAAPSSDGALPRD